MEKFTEDGIVIKTSATGESDLVVWILTRTRGIIRAFAKGARGTKSRLHGAASLFAYCAFSFTEKNKVYHISEGEVREIFFDLRGSLEKLTVAQYFCEIALKTVPDETGDEVFLRLMLNSLYLLCKSEKPWQQIKAVFEFRVAAETGYMPSLIACEECGEYQTDIMYFDVGEGLLYCSECGRYKNIPEVPAAVVAAMRHIIFSPFEKIYSFELPSELYEVLNRITERYLGMCTHQSFKTLEFLSREGGR